jgi:DNA-3-methyladenine glycosylase
LRLPKPLPRSFYARPTVEVARDLLGKIVSLGEASGRITEVEAYLGVGDEAAHSARGITDRTRVLFGPPGHAYIYLIYGMYDCLNFVTESDGIAGGVLIRAIEPIAGINRSADGPGKLTLALGITRAQNGADLTCGPITVHRDPRAKPFKIEVSKRIGITKSADLPLRFLIGRE